MGAVEEFLTQDSSKVPVTSFHCLHIKCHGPGGKFNSNKLQYKINFINFILSQINSS